MPDTGQTKQIGLKYARSLQTLLKTAIMFSPGHAGVNQPLQHSFDQLNEIVKQLGQFTIGFVDQRVMLNKILTSEPALKTLENEFLKRGIGAVTFEAGITMTGYRKVIAVMAAPVKTIEEHGLHSYLIRNPLEFARIIPAAKNQQRSESGDTILETDSESYLMSKALADLRTPGMEKFDWLLQTAGIAGPGGDGGSDRGGYGGGFSSGGIGSGGVPSAPGGYAAAAAAGTGTGISNGSTVGTATPSTAPASAAVLGPPGGGPGGITAIVEGYFNSTLMEGKDATPHSYVELARVIAESRPEVVLASFPPKRREQLRQMPPDQMAAEVIEDTAVKWATERLAAAPPGSDGVIVEQEVIRVLLRSLQATQVASRLVDKLAGHIRELNIPETTTNRIRGELEWAVVPAKEKTRRLLQFKKFEAHQFRRLLLHIQELLKAGELTTVTQLANHYLLVIDEKVQPEPEEMGRFPELIQTLGGFRSDFWQTSSTRFCNSLTRLADHVLLHQQLLNALVAVAHTVSKFEEFEIVESIGTAIHGILTSNPEKHQKCCGAALSTLVSTQACERILELYLQKRDEGNLPRTASALLRFSGPPGIGKAILLLQEEKTAAGRLALIRLIARVGPVALDPARKCLEDSRWFVVRNGCKLLVQLKDPELLSRLAPMLRHQEERVQKAALDAIRESRDPGRAVVLAESLPFLRPQLREDALGELLFLRDPASIPALDRLLFSDPKGTLQAACTQTLAAIPGKEAHRALLHVLSSRSLGVAARRIALSALIRANSTEIDEALRQYAESEPNDAMASEMKKSLESRS
ncbi:MAG: HEAT repeat domain-containing protein [Acidobacteriaceae bacterium]